jgi:predicted dehydrogenase
MDNKEQNVTAGSETRRGFLRKAATLTAAAASTNLFTPVYGQTTAPSAGVAGANSRINIGHIGLGIQGFGAHVKLLKAQAAALNVVQTGVCDVWSKRNDTAKAFLEEGGGKVTAYDDYRKMLENKDIDAVVIATHDVWHTKMSCDAMQAGKHVYCEKPLSRYLGEAFEIHKAATDTKKIFQLGSQGCSAQGWHEAAKMIKAGKLGPLIWGQGFYCRNNPKGEWNYTIEADATAANVKWNDWCGQAKKHPGEFSPEYYFRWRKFYPFCAGLLGDLMPHRLHPLVVATGNPEFPTRVTCVGTKIVNTDKKSPGALNRDVPEHIELTAEFPSGLMLVCACSTVNAKSPGFQIYGHYGILEIGNIGERLRYTPEQPFTDDYEPDEKNGLQPTEDISVHHKNWIDCIRSNTQPNANIDLATKVQTIISLAEMSDRLKVTCMFDEKTRKVYVGDGKEGGKKEIEPITYGTLNLS